MLDIKRIVKELQAPGAAPLHARVRDAIHAQIADGTLQPGDALPPERALKEQLGISRVTIRQAIKTLIHDGMLRSVVGAGTFVLEPQRSPTHHPLVGIVVSDNNYSVYYPELISSLSRSLRNAGYRIDLNIHNNRYETFSQVMESLLTQHAAAIAIVAPNQNDSRETVQRLQQQEIVPLLLTRDVENVGDVDYIGANNHLIGHDATQHLIDLGHRNILHVAGSHTSTAHDRAAGYVAAMTDAGLAPQLVISPNEPGVLAPALMRHVQTDDLTELWGQVARQEITGIFCFNDQIAGWVQKEIRKLNLTIPRDLSLISVDNMPFAGFFDTPLTTFALPGEEIGRQAANLLLRRLNGDQFPAQRILLPARLVQRRSTAWPPKR